MHTVSIIYHKNTLLMHYKLFHPIGLKIGWCATVDMRGQWVMMLGGATHCVTVCVLCLCVHVVVFLAGLRFSYQVVSNRDASAATLIYIQASWMIAMKCLR